MTNKCLGYSIEASFSCRFLGVEILWLFIVTWGKWNFTCVWEVRVNSEQQRWNSQWSARPRREYFHLSQPVQLLMPFAVVSTLRIHFIIPPSKKERQKKDGKGWRSLSNKYIQYCPIQKEKMLSLQQHYWHCRVQRKIVFFFTLSRCSFFNL